MWVEREKTGAFHWANAIVKWSAVVSIGRRAGANKNEEDEQEEEDEEEDEEEEVAHPAMDG